MKVQYQLKNSYKFFQLLLLLLGVVLTILRWRNTFNPNIVVINSEITSHISNFSLSLITYLAIGSMWILLGTEFRYVFYLGVFMIAANFICETLMGFMNTADIKDALYGTIGIVIVFIYLWYVNKYGLIDNISDNQS